MKFLPLPANFALIMTLFFLIAGVFNCFCVPFIMNLNPFAFVNRYFWNLIVLPAIDFGNRSNFLIFRSSASYVIIKIQYIFIFL